jgi:hypothetical protein
LIYSGAVIFVISCYMLSVFWNFVCYILLALVQYNLQTHIHTTSTIFNLHRIFTAVDPLKWWFPPKSSNGPGNVFSPHKTIIPTLLDKSALYLCLISNFWLDMSISWLSNSPTHKQHIVFLSFLCVFVTNDSVLHCYIHSNL